MNGRSTTARRRGRRALRLEAKLERRAGRPNPLPFHAVKLPFHAVNWTQSVQGAYKVLSPGGRVSLNVWTKTSAEIDTVILRVGECRIQRDQDLWIRGGHDDHGSEVR
jgi:hypothetical protein